ncbi:hypothetical protein [Paenibacillus brevis]|uniref:Uncharacterized protein n=1 Tax=Paenibacillus brevis TaxID=2841508 RepID=A0ABS6FJ81_9BACL|nr:hypothetical protein [Paenibacillus brevis]MBU5670235.1 hypothetical protein [Paenibacillus brevis]
MKLRKFHVALAIIFLSLLLLSCTDSKKEIDISNSAYLYGNEVKETSEIKMKGEYDTKKHSFIGSLSIGNGITFDNITFSSGSGLISYNKATRAYLGQIFFDHNSLELTIEITDKDLYQKLTHSINDGEKKITITSPATNIEDAKRINSELKNKELPFEK